MFIKLCFTQKSSIELTKPKGQVPEINHHAKEYMNTVDMYLGTLWQKDLLLEKKGNYIESTENQKNFRRCCNWYVHQEMSF